MQPWCAAGSSPRQPHPPLRPLWFGLAVAKPAPISCLAQGPGDRGCSIPCSRSLAPLGPRGGLEGEEATKSLGWGHRGSKRKLPAPCDSARARVPSPEGRRCWAPSSPCRAQGPSSAPSPRHPGCPDPAAPAQPPAAMPVTITLPGPAPWGFRITGGRDFGKPITVSKVGAPPGPWGGMLGQAPYRGCSGSGSCLVTLRDPAPWGWVMVGMGSLSLAGPCHVSTMDPILGLGTTTELAVPICALGDGDARGLHDACVGLRGGREGGGRCPQHLQDNTGPIPMSHGGDGAREGGRG